MLDRCTQTVLSLLFGSLVCLVLTSVVNADGRVFVLDLRNSSELRGFRDAERACASLDARLASAEELRHAVAECFFSPCARGWLYGGTVGNTVCNVVGSSLKAVDVRTENATEDTAHLDAFCIKDKGAPCGDPPSFPNARLQGHTGFDMGDELLYTCAPGYVMPSGHSAFSLLCDSCGEWYGLVQICIKDETESHIDYEDKFTDSYGEGEPHSERPEEAHGKVYEEVHGAVYPERKRSEEQQDVTEYQGLHGKQEQQMIVRKTEDVVEGDEKDEGRAVEDFIGHPRWEQERREVVRIDSAAATEAPVSLLSQKHMFWFPSEAFQEEGHPVSTSPVTQNTQRASGAQSEESKEHESQERHHHHHHLAVDADDHEQESYDDHDTDDRDDTEDSRQDVHEDSHHDDQDDHDSHQDEDDHDDQVKHYIPAQHDDLDRRDRHEKNYDDHHDHYDMGEHEDDRVRYGSQEYDDRDDTYDEHESYEDHEDVTDNHDDVDLKNPKDSKEDSDHDDHDDNQEHYVEEDDNDHYTDHDSHDDDDHDHDHDDHDHDDHGHDDHDSYDDHDSHENDGDGHQHVIFSIGTGERQNVSQKEVEEQATTDETWLDGYPIEETDIGDSTTERVRPEDKERGALSRTTDRPNEVEIRRPVSYTSLPEEHESPTVEPEQQGKKEVWPGFDTTAVPSPDHLEPSDSPSYSDTLDYDTQQAAPTHSWQGDLTDHPLLDYGPAPPVHDGDILTGVVGEHTEHHLPGETGERGEVAGEMGETPNPPSSSGRGPTVAAIIVAVCAVAVAVIVGVWCYRRQQQKSSLYEMNGKGQTQTRQGQQIEMQQKV